MTARCTIRGKYALVMCAFLGGACEREPVAPGTVSHPVAMPQLGLLAVIDPAVVLLSGGSGTGVTAISPNGRWVVGSHAMSGSTAFAAFDGGTAGDLGVMADDSHAYDVNNAGIIVGEFGASAAYWRGFSAPVLLPTPAGHTDATAVAVGEGRNPVVVGYAHLSAGRYRAVRWNIGAPGGPTYTLLPDGSGGSDATGVNVEAGVIVGTTYDGTGHHVARWNLTTNDLTETTIEGTPMAVNRAGIIVTGNGLIIEPDGTVHTASPLLRDINDRNYAIGLDGAMWKLANPLSVSGFGDDGSGISARFTTISDNNLVGGFYTTDLSTYYAFYSTVAINRDRDDDLVADATDNCIAVSNSDQADADSDGVGDLCDLINVTHRPANGHEGSFVRFIAAGFDAGNPNTVYTWHFSDGETIEGRVVEKAFGEQGTYEYYATGSHGSGNPTLATSATGSVTIANARPDVNIMNFASIVQSGVGLPITLRIDDPGADDTPIGWTLHWGDGTSQAGACTNADGCTYNLSHVFTVLGSNTITVVATDKDGARTRRTTSNTIVRRSVSAQVSPGVAGDDISQGSAEFEIAILSVDGSFDASQLVAGSVYITDGIGTAVQSAGFNSPTDVDGDLVPDGVARFNTAAVRAAGNLATPGTVFLVITGQLADGTYFVANVSANLTP